MIFGPNQRELEVYITHLKEEDDHGEGETRYGADEDPADGAEADAVGVIEHRAVVLEVGRPIAFYYVDAILIKAFNLS